MALVKQAIKLRTAPAEVDDNLRLELVRDRSDLPQRHPADLPALDSRDHVLRHLCAPCEVVLPPIETLPQSTEPRAEPNILHLPGILGCRAYLGITYASGASYPPSAQHPGCGTSSQWVT
jgi:hypothetical protein